MTLDLLLHLILAYQVLVACRVVIIREELCQQQVHVLAPCSRGILRPISSSASLLLIKVLDVDTTVSTSVTLFRIDKLDVSSTRLLTDEVVDSM